MKAILVEKFVKVSREALFRLHHELVFFAS
jgi:hypothetical protein